MAQIDKGILGGFRGKVGNVVGTRWRDKDIIRSLPSKSSKEPSLAQINQKLKFGKVMRFTSPAQQLISKFFGQPQSSRSRYNLAVSYHLKNSVTIVDAAAEIIYEKALFSKGDLPGLQAATLTNPTAQNLNLVWTDNSNQGLATATDQLYVVLYVPEFDDYFILEQVATRDAATYSTSLPAYYSNFEVEAWGFFANEKGSIAATSVYLGKVTLQ